MAPARKKATAQTQRQQQTLQSFARVSKAGARSSVDKSALQKAVALAANDPPTQRTPGNSKKRRHDDDVDEAGANDDSTNCPLKSVPAKKPKLQLPSPPLSHASKDASPTSPVSLSPLRLSGWPSRSTTPQDLPVAIQELVTIHESFLRALSVHYAHSGTATPAELTNLLRTITRLYKKRVVSREDVQRMLALYEVAANIDAIFGPKIEHRHGPFRLTSAGGRECIEYAAAGAHSHSPSGLFNERHLQTLFKADVQSLLISSRSDLRLSFVHGALSDFPLLLAVVGAQTTDRKEKAAARRSEILGFGLKNTHHTGLWGPEAVKSQPDPFLAPSVKARTLSLFDRVRQKQLAGGSNAKPTADAQLRRHAIGRIAEVVEILRMKQRQKMNSSFVSAVHVSPSKVNARVSYSMNQLVMEIRNSVAVPIGEDAAKLCLRMLADEIPGTWLALIELGQAPNTITSVVLNGHGMSGVETQRILLEKQNMK